MTAQGGTQTIPAFTDPPEIQFAHGCGVTPTVVLVTPQDDLGSRRAMAKDTRVDGTYIVIEMDSIDGIDHGFWWYGE